MVKSEKKAVVARTASKSSRKKSREKEYETNILDYGESQIEGTDVVVSVAVATFVLKNEDRHQVLRVGDDSKFRTCERSVQCDGMSVGCWLPMAEYYKDTPDWFWKSDSFSVNRLPLFSFLKN